MRGCGLLVAGTLLTVFYSSASAQTFPDREAEVRALGFLPANVRDFGIQYGVGTANLTGGNQAKGVWVSVAEQKHLAVALGFAVAKGDKATADQLLGSVNWTFDKMNPDGSFPLYNVSTLAPITNQKSIATAASAFLVELVPALMGAQATFRGYATVLKPLKDKVALAAKFCYAWREGMFAQGDGAANAQVRFAAMWTELGVYLNTSRYLDAGRRYTDLTLGLQTNQGYFLEHNGFDTSYQLITLRYLARLMFLDPTEAVRQSLQKGLDWSLGRFMVDGRIDTRGNTRTYVGISNQWTEEKIGHFPPFLCSSVCLSAYALGVGEAYAPLNRWSSVAIVGGFLAPPSAYLFR